MSEKISIAGRANLIGESYKLVNKSLLVKDDFRNVDIVCSEILNKEISESKGLDLAELISPSLDFKVGNTTPDEVVRWTLGSLPAIIRRVKDVEKGSIVNTATSLDICWWLSSVAWSILVASYSDTDLKDISCWIDTTVNMSHKESTWISLEGGVVNIRRDWCGGTAWCGSRDAVVCKSPNTFQNMTKELFNYNLVYISWQQFNHERDLKS